MSMNDASSAGDKFSLVVKKHRASLSKDERKLLALKHIADQADLVLARHKTAVDAQASRLKQMEADAAEARKNFEAAKAELEGK